MRHARAYCCDFDGHDFHHHGHHGHHADHGQPGHHGNQGPFWGRFAAMGEMWALFNDWLESMEDEVVAFARERGDVQPEDVAERFKISRRAARILLNRLHRDGRMRSRGYAASAETSEEPSEPTSA